MSGSFHLALAAHAENTPGEAYNHEALARAFIGCTRVRGIVRHVVWSRGVLEDYETVLHDTWFACAERFARLDKPVNVYSMIYKTADNLALAAYRAQRAERLAEHPDEADFIDRAEIDETGILPDGFGEVQAEPSTLAERVAEEEGTERSRAAFLRKRLAMDVTDRNAGGDEPASTSAHKPGRPAADLPNRHAQLPKVLELNAIRQELNLTISEFAIACSLSKDRMYSYLRGRVQSDTILESVLEQARLLCYQKEAGK